MHTRALHTRTRMRTRTRTLQTLAHSHAHAYSRLPTLTHITPTRSRAATRSHSFGGNELCWTLLSYMYDDQSYAMLRFGTSPSRACEDDVVFVTERRGSGSGRSGSSGSDTGDSHPALDVNRTIHEATGAKVVLHSHDSVSAFFSMSDRPLRPLIQESVYFYGDRFVSHAPEDHISVLATRLRASPHAIAANLLNHGSATWGNALPETVVRFYYLRRAMAAQMHAESQHGSVEVNEPPKALVAELQRRWESDDDRRYAGGKCEYECLLAEADRRRPSDQRVDQVGMGVIGAVNGGAGRSIIR